MNMTDVCDTLANAHMTTQCIKSDAGLYYCWDKTGKYLPLAYALIPNGYNANVIILYYTRL